MWAGLLDFKPIVAFRGGFNNTSSSAAFSTLRRKKDWFGYIIIAVFLRVWPPIPVINLKVVGSIK